MRIDEGEVRAGLREWVGLGVLALPCAVYAMDLTVLNLAVPALTADLDPTSVELLWIVDIYGFLVAGLLIAMGALGDRLGRRRVLLVGAGAFAVASILAAWAPTAETLIAARALLGVAGATLAPSTLALIRTMFADAQQRTVAISVWITSFSVGAAVGPLVGGALLEHFWWGSVFLPAVPVMVVLMALVPSLLPEFRDRAAGRLDLSSVALALASVLSLIYGLKQIAQGGLGWSAASVVAAGLGAGLGFMRRQHHLASPLIDLRLFRAPAFNVALMAYTVGFFVNFGCLLFVAQYLQLVLGLSPLEAGAWTVPGAAAFVVGSLLTPALLRMLLPGTVVTAGLVLASLGYATLAMVSDGSGLTVLVVGSVVGSLGLSAVFTVATDLVVAAASPERAGAASAIAETGSELGGALGIAVLGTLGAVAYRNDLADTLPSTVPTDAGQAAHETLGAASAASSRLSEPLAGEVLDAARDAFVTGFHLAAAVSAAALLLAAGLTLRYLRPHHPPGPTTAPEIGGQVAVGPLPVPTAAGCPVDGPTHGDVPS